MNPGQRWAAGMQEAAKRQLSVRSEMRAKHLRIHKWGKWFAETFKVGVGKFYKDIYMGFDQLAFDDYLMTLDEEYRKANAGELGEDVDCSMETHLRTKYGERAAKRIRSFI